MAGFKRQLLNGKWELCISLGYDDTSKQIQKPLIPLIFPMKIKISGG